LVENQQSKSLLNVLCHILINKLNNSSYFPSYEYVIDLLRDYSCFKDDKVHPNDTSVVKLYDFFIDQFFDSISKEVITKWQKINSSLKHKSLRPYSSSNLKFKENLKSQLENFVTQYQLPCGNEIEDVDIEIRKIRQEI